MAHIVILGTFDTKCQELLHLRSQIERAGAGKITLVDAGRSPVDIPEITIKQATLVTKYAPASDKRDVADLTRGDVIKYMISCASNWLREAYRAGLEDPSQAIHGIVAAGGTGGTSLASSVMRGTLPIGFPKLIISTNASGDTGPVVGETDITMMYSVVDIAGTNSLLRRILANAAGAITGMAQVHANTPSSTNQTQESQRKRVGLTMFGVTTPCVDRVREHLEANYPIECFVFHCTGHGGKAMERLVEEAGLDAVLDLTTTEICDNIAGGVMDAGPDRLEASLKAGIPYIISVGATDMVNFGPKSTVPEKYQGRTLFEHNPVVTLMRTSPAECTSIGQFIVHKVKTFARNPSKVEVVLPRGGVSVVALPGAPFYDSDADNALFSAIEEGLKDTDITTIDDHRDINDSAFAVDVAERLVKLMDM